MHPSPSKILFAGTIFTSAFLLFLVQPLIAKQILPWFGGSAAVWSICMVFFQVVLLAGYAYSDWITRHLRMRAQATLHLALLLASLAFLPIVTSARWKPAGAEDPSLWILGLLVATIGLPYFLLSTTGPLVQSWVSRTPWGAQVYRYFSLSNLASLASLLAYPVLIEPRSTLVQQAWGWSAGYAIFTLLCAGTALHMAGTKVKKKMAKFAAALFEAHEDDLVFENGTISVKGSPASAKPFASVAAYAYVPVPLPDGLEPGLSDEAFFEPTNNTYPFGCHISMLEIDRDTGEPKLLKLVAVDDAGNLINPLIVEGQIHGGLAQGIGQAMIEEVVYGEDGQLLTGSFMDYALPRAIDFPRFELGATVTPTPVNPLGAKGVGEAGTLGSTPCIVNAAVDALSEFGVKHIDMMLRPEKLWRIIHGGRS